MKALVSKSEIKGRVRAPSSKSYTIRGLMCAALAEGESRIISPLGSDDTGAACEVLGKTGIGVRQDKDVWLVKGGNFKAPESDLHCRESAATLRFMTAVSAIVPGECRLTAAPSLAVRPVAPLVRALAQWGVDCRYDEKSASVIVNGGRLNGGMTEIPGNISSQFVTALLMVAPFTENGAEIRLTTPLESRPFVRMTLECLEKFGIKIGASNDLREYKIKKQKYRPADYVVEGDWSSASYLLTLGALLGETQVEGLNPESLQGDRAILEILRRMGAGIKLEKGLITVKRGELKAVNADLNDCIDLLPTVAVLAAAAAGTSELTGIGRARLKESDRISTVAEGLKRMGVKVIEEKDRLSVTGSPLRGATIDTRADHRIAMAFSMLGSVAGDTVIENAECVAKTYPEYWRTLMNIGGEVNLNGK
jgi:3-phosphoshikimate 1-carboxyvinyltransferase